VGANCKRVCWVPVFNALNHSDAVSRLALDLETSSDSGVGGKGCERTPKSFDLLKIWAKPPKIRGKIAQNLGTVVSTPLLSLCDE